MSVASISVISAYNLSFPSCVFVIHDNVPPVSAGSYYSIITVIRGTGNLKQHIYGVGLQFNTQFVPTTPT